MTEARNQADNNWEAYLADPALAPFQKPDLAALVWKRDLSKILWASSAARPLADQLDKGIAENHFITSATRERLIKLALGDAPLTGIRLERLVLDPQAFGARVTCACKRIILSNGEEALLTLISGSVPKPSPILPPLSLADLPRPFQIETSLDVLVRTKPRGTLRFIWEADEKGRFSRLTSELESVVGEKNALILGKTWPELIKARLVDDPSRIISDLFARQETWSGRTVFWTIEGTDQLLPVDLAGIPHFDKNRHLIGYRGFGLCRTDVFPAQEEAVPDFVPDTLSDTLSEKNEESAIEEHSVPRHWGWSMSASSESSFEDHIEQPVDRVHSDEDVDVTYFTDHETVDPSLDNNNLWGDRAYKGLSFSSGPLNVAAQLGEADHIDLSEDNEGSEEVITGKSFDAISLVDVHSQDDTSDILEEGPVDGETDEEPEASVVPISYDSSRFSSLSTRIGAQLGDPPAIPLIRVDDVVSEEAELDEQAPVDAKPFDDTPSTLERAALDLKKTQDQDETDARLSMAERSAFREIAKALGARFEDEPLPAEPSVLKPLSETTSSDSLTQTKQKKTKNLISNARPFGQKLLDYLPLPLLVSREEKTLFANRLFFELSGYDSLESFHASGGLDQLFKGRDHQESSLALICKDGSSRPVEARLLSFEWEEEPASLLALRPLGENETLPLSRQIEIESRDSRIQELSSILDTATDGVIVVDESGRILSLNRSAEALFGYDQKEVAGEPLAMLFAPESQSLALDYLEGLQSNGVASLLNDGREVFGRVRQGGMIPLFMTMGRVSDKPERKFCAVLRDVTAFKKAERELVAAKKTAESSSAQKSDILAKISHEIRTPMNAIIGFAEVMLEERFGPVTNERYRDYLKDIHDSGGYVVSLVNDLLDLAKIEAGRMDLSFTSVDLNDITTQCVSLLQPQSARERIVLRSSFAQKLPPVVADERSMRQIVLNILSNAIKFTDAGGQVIVSTAFTERGEVALRVRDTGIGMTNQEIEAALEPFRQLATSRKAGGTGLGLPLTKALVEANRGMFEISSTKHEGTLVEVLFPPTRVLAE